MRLQETYDINLECWSTRHRNFSPNFITKMRYLFHTQQTFICISCYSATRHIPLRIFPVVPLSVQKKAFIGLLPSPVIVHSLLLFTPSRSLSPERTVTRKRKRGWKSTSARWEPGGSFVRDPNALFHPPQVVLPHR